MTASHVGDIARYLMFPSSAHQGHRAVVVRLADWPSDERLLEVASQTGVEETTFLVLGKDGPELRWFTHEVEVPLCGHGALAAAFDVIDMLEADTWLEVANRRGELWLSRDGETPKIALKRTVINRLSRSQFALPWPMSEIYDAGRDYLMVLESEQQLARIGPSPEIAALPKIGLIVSAPSTRYRASFRFFAPRVGIAEDPLSLSTLPALVARWGQGAVGDLVFCQRSPTPAVIHATCIEERVVISGPVVDRSKT
jgi:predicted PhzF superfamily epimerase YddE/YHI9